MSEIHLQVEDRKTPLVLSILENLKDGIIQEIKVFTNDKELKEYIQAKQHQKDKEKF